MSVTGCRKVYPKGGSAVAVVNVLDLPSAQYARQRLGVRRPSAALESCDLAECSIQSLIVYLFTISPPGETPGRQDLNEDISPRLRSGSGHAASHKCASNASVPWRC